MKRLMKLCAIVLITWVCITNVRADGNPFEGASWDTGIMTGTTTEPSAEATERPQATPVPGQDTEAPQPSAPSQQEPDSPSTATYRYLTGTPGSGVPLYKSSTASAEYKYLTRGDLVLVHEYANGRARITFGGHKGWVNTSVLTKTRPGTGEQVGYRYAYNGSETVPLYRYGFEYAIATVPSGAKVAVTDMKEDGYVYVMHGAVSGWMKSSHLVKKLPSGIDSQEGSSYYYRSLVGDTTGQAIQLYNDSSCGAWGKCGTLPEGTVVKVLDTQLNIRISYGGKEYYVKPRNVFRELSGGSSNAVDSGVTAPSAEKQSPVDAPDTPEKNDEAKSAQSSSKKKTAAVRSEDKKPAAQSRVSVELVYVGIAESMIRDADGERIVRTADLEFESAAPVGKRIAYIYAPKTGKCSLWKKASKDSDLIKKCKAGTVVLVLDAGYKFCKIRYEGKEGYVLTSCLKSAGEGTEVLGSGKISYKGKMTGTTTVNIRGAGSSDAHRIAEWRTGTEVTVFSHQKGWYEVEYQGVHGWVQDKYLTMDE